MGKIASLLRRMLAKPTPERKVYPKISILAPSELLSGRTALITGGTSGIGYEIAKAFIDAGCFVVITGRNQERVDDACRRIAEQVQRKGQVLGFELNNLRVDSFKDVLDRIILAVPSHRIDILVNNAGVLGGHFSDADEALYDSVMDTNLKGPFFLTQAVAHHMKEHGIEGNILNVASSSSLRPADSAYCLSKWGIRGFTEGAARSLAPFGIVVNGIAPGPTATPMLMHNGKDDISWPSNLTGRMVTPQEVAQMAVILVSHMSRMVIGDIVYMTGGGGNITNEDVHYYFE